MECPDFLSFFLNKIYLFYRPPEIFAIACALPFLIGTVLRRYTSTESHSLLRLSELNVETKVPKDNRIDFTIDVTDKDFSPAHVAVFLLSNQSKSTTQGT